MKGKLNFSAAWLSRGQTFWPVKLIACLLEELGYFYMVNFLPSYFRNLYSTGLYNLAMPCL